MSRNLLAVLVAVGVLGGGPIVSVAKAEVTVAPASDRFPLPVDAVAQQQQGKEPSKTSKSSDNRIRIYDVPRSREAVVTEARAALKTGKWQIVKDEPSAPGKPARLTVKKNGKTWRASFTGDDQQAVIIVTAPAS